MLKPVAVMVTAIAMLCMPGSANAAFGDLDATFGIGGKQRNVAQVGTANPQIRLQADGGVLYSQGRLQGLGSLTRRKPDGSADDSFGLEGFIRGPSDQHVVADFELLSDQRIAVLHHLWVGTNRSGSLSLYSATGELEWRFDLESLSQKLQPASIAIQGSSILVSGGLPPSSVGLVRITESGALDAAFGNAGFASVTGFASGGPGLSAVGVGRDGSIVLGLDRTLGGPAFETSSAFAKFDADGAPVAGFGTGGISVSIKSMYLHGVRDVAVSSSGSVAAITRSGFPGSRGSYAMWEYSHLLTSTGEFVQRTSRDTFSKSSIPGASSFIDVVAMPDSGFAFAGGDRVSVVDDRRVPQNRFDSNGIVTVAIGPHNVWTAIDVADDGRIAAAGTSCKTTKPADGSCRQVITRLLGFAGGVGAPQPRLSTSVAPVYWLGNPRATKLTKVEGVAGPAGELKGVGVAIRRIENRKRLRGRCRWIARAGLSTRLVRDRSKKCDRPLFMAAKVAANGDWSFAFRRRLPVGSYRLYLRATKLDGTHNPVNDDSDTFVVFKVKKYKKR